MQECNSNYNLLENKKMKLFLYIKLVVVFFVSLLVTPTYANNDTSESVIGRIILVSGGSSAKDYIMPIVLKAFDRSRIILGYVTYSYWPSETGTVFGNSSSDSSNSMLGSLELPAAAKIYYVMINCKEETYAHYPPYSSESNTNIKIFYNGDSFKWGEFDFILNSESDTAHQMLAPWGKEEVTKLFYDACDEA